MGDLWQRVHGHRNEPFFDSFYRDNPLGEPFLGLCYHEGALVGQENYVLQDLWHRGRIFRGAMGIDTVVLPEYRLFHGIFGTLCRLTIEELGKQVDFLFAYANEESKKYYLKYFGWQVAGQIGVYKKITGFSGLRAESLLALLRPGRRQRGLALESVGRFPDELDPLIERHRLTAPYASFRKTAACLNWKFLRNRHYATEGCLLHADGRLRGYFVTHTSGTERKVVDFLVEDDDPGLLAKALSHLAWLTREQGGKRLVICAVPGAWYEPLLRTLGFFKREEFDFIGRFFTADVPRTGWLVHAGDFDIF